MKKKIITVLILYFLFINCFAQTTNPILGVWAKPGQENASFEIGSDSIYYTNASKGCSYNMGGTSNISIYFDGVRKDGTYEIKNGDLLLSFNGIINRYVRFVSGYCTDKCDPASSTFDPVVCVDVCKCKVKVKLTVYFDYVYAFAYLTAEGLDLSKCIVYVDDWSCETFDGSGCATPTYPSITDLTAVDGAASNNYEYSVIYLTGGGGKGYYCSQQFRYRVYDPSTGITYHSDLQEGDYTGQ